jgi:hypothetical protein
MGHQKVRGLALSTRHAISSDDVSIADHASQKLFFRNAQANASHQYTILKTEQVYTHPMENVNGEFEKQ